MARGWPDKKALPPEFYSYFEKRTELSYEQDTKKFTLFVFTITQSDVDQF